MDLEFNNDSYNLNLRTDYYTSGSITLNNITVKRTTKKSYTKTYGESLGTMPSPIESGYTLDGWYTAPTGGTKVTESTPVPSANTTYYANWIAN